MHNRSPAGTVGPPDGLDQPNPETVSNNSGIVIEIDEATARMLEEIGTQIAKFSSGIVIEVDEATARRLEELDEQITAWEASGRRPPLTEEELRRVEALDTDMSAYEAWHIGNGAPLHSKRHRNTKRTTALH